MIEASGMQGLEALFLPQASITGQKAEAAGLDSKLISRREAIFQIGPSGLHLLLSMFHGAPPPECGLDRMICF